MTAEPIREHGDSSPLPFTPTPWAAQGACRGKPMTLWFPPEGGSVAAGKAICAGCPVRTQCLDYAVAFGVHHGTFGGLSARERADVRRERRAGRKRRAEADVRRGERMPTRTGNTQSQRARYGPADLDALEALLAGAHARLNAREEHAA